MDPDRHHFKTIRTAKAFIHGSMGSDSPARVTKAVLFLALYIQQLPNSIANQQTKLSVHPEARLDSYLLLANMLLSISGDTTPTIDGLECLIILAKLYMNMGKVRESWLSIRRAINLGLLLRLHNAAGPGKDREHELWSHLWQTDRQLSLVLGLPASKDYIILLRL
ncbi:hypothetical protein G7Y89_g11977 [Cudoniella acicularis]|uniref:Xylanolytic transcriptional activator regulatory domain-containing protein n=1 Tax=Cudoniella acicularis TaxID=354080 RepID=A0A8H4RCG0_9HELO|nr:hypothetical protein G7Y89_g11977 [Cudoniella acicularis]